VLIKNKGGLMYCNNCKKDVYTKTVTTNHAMNFIMTIVTMGLWLPVWFLLAATQNTEVCGKCNSFLK